jgi:hypothetical protein
MHLTIFKTTARRITKLTGKAKAAIDKRLETSSKKERTKIVAQHTYSQRRQSQPKNVVMESKNHLLKSQCPASLGAEQMSQLHLKFMWHQADKP